MGYPFKLKEIVIMKRGSLGWGILLILVGGYFLAVQFGFLPDLTEYYDWPFWIIGLGLLFILIDLITGTSGMAVPGAIITGIGSLLYYYSETGNWTDWTLWLLVPTFVGVGTFLMYLFEGRIQKAFREGGSGIIWGLVLYSIFAAIFGGPMLLGDYWPVLIILVGLWLLVRPFFRRRKVADADKDIDVDVDVDII
jgi:hypothetical protein